MASANITPIVNPIAEALTQPSMAQVVTIYHLRLLVSSADLEFSNPRFGLGTSGTYGARWLLCYSGGSRCS